jgi:hypothetical protein
LCSMRLVHLLVDPDLKPAFIAAESLQGRVDSDDTKAFWQLAAAKFNDDAWEPQHLFPTDPHLARISAFNPTKKSKEVCGRLLLASRRNGACLPCPPAVVRRAFAHFIVSAWCAGGPGLLARKVQVTQKTFQYQRGAME